MGTEDSRLKAAIAGFDAFNGEDPNTETFEGEAHPKELLYARRMTGWLEKLAPEASDALRLAVRCQHIGRWTIGRDEYPEGVKGYYQWRGALAEFHARTAGGIMGEVGYDAGAIARVRQLVRKQKLKTDPETQLLEDVACLVFLENYFAEFSKKHDDAKVIGIIQKTWAKMSPKGHEEALKLKDALPPDRRELIDKALGG
jgi:hypothetical protein